MGFLQFFLRVEVLRTPNGIYLSQTKYITDMFRETSLLGAKPVDSPLENGVKLKPDRWKIQEGMNDL